MSNLPSHATHLNAVANILNRVPDVVVTSTSVLVTPMTDGEINETLQPLNTYSRVDTGMRCPSGIYKNNMSSARVQAGATNYTDPTTWNYGNQTNEYLERGMRLIATEMNDACREAADNPAAAKRFEFLKSSLGKALSAQEKLKSDSSLNAVLVAFRAMDWEYVYLLSDMYAVSGVALGELDGSDIPKAHFELSRRLIANQTLHNAISNKLDRLGVTDPSRFYVIEYNQRAWSADEKARNPIHRVPQSINEDWCTFFTTVGAQLEQSLLDLPDFKELV